MTLLDQLIFLYGEPTAREVLPRLRELMLKYRSPLNPTGDLKPALPLDERDVLLITYGDQVREVGVPPLQTWADLAEKHLTGLVSGVHILPFFPYSSDDGFSVIDYYAVDPQLGRWDDVQRLGQNFDLMFDAVINHVSAESEWFRRFLQDDPAYRDYFIVVAGDPDLSRVVRPRALPLLTPFQTPSGEKKVWTTFSADQIDLNYHQPQVLLQMLDVLLYYVARGARFLRLDAVAFLWKELGTSCIHLPQTHAVVQLVRGVLDEVAPEVRLITETNVPHADNVSYFGNGTNEAQLVYNFALPPLMLHTFHTGNATALARWAATLTLPSERTTFFNFLASHDGIGLNPVRGILTAAEIEALVARTLEHGGLVSYKHNPDGTSSPYELNINYFDALSDPNASEPLDVQVDRFMTAQAIMLALVGVPGIYFHSLFGSRGDRAGAAAAGIPRRINRQKLTLEELERGLGDWHSLRAQVFTRHAELLRVRRACSAFHPNGAQRILACGERMFGVLRVSPNGRERVLCLHNVGNTRAAVELEFSGGRWVDLLRGGVYAARADGVLEIELEPYQTAWLHTANSSD
jgi:glucosylglycerate phosphorylase